MTLVHTNGNDFGGKAAAKGFFVFPLGSATGSFIPSFSRGYKRTDTLATEVPFRFLLQAENDDVCNNIPDSERARVGLSDWLASLIAGLNFNVGYDPPGQVDSIKFSQDYAVTNTTKGGGRFRCCLLKRQYDGAQRAK